MAGRPQRRAAQRAFGMGVMPQRASSSAVSITAPIGGINTSAPAAAMPPSDCLFLYNMIPFQYGLRVRAGWYEYAT